MGQVEQAEGLEKIQATGSRPAADDVDSRAPMGARARCACPVGMLMWFCWYCNHGRSMNAKQVLGSKMLGKFFLTHVVLMLGVLSYPEKFPVL